MVQTTAKNMVKIPSKYSGIDTTKAKTNRSWGSYEWAFIAQNFMVKIVTIDPGKSQKLHRHWCKNKTCVVTKGALEVIYLDEDTNERSSKLIKDNYSVTINAGTIHALKNPGTRELQIIEIQTGHTVVDNDVSYTKFEKGEIIDEPPNEDRVEIKLEPSDLDNPDSFLNNETRPWGRWSSIANGENYQVKVIEVSPKQRLSDQLHYYRSEHWVVAGGAAKVVKEKETADGKTEIRRKIYKFGESVFIPACKRHRIINPGTELSTTIVEVQVGPYLGEDDIVRFQDDYHRS